MPDADSKIERNFRDFGACFSFFYFNKNKGLAGSVASA